MKYYLAAFKKYSVLEGRSTRKEYWYFVLFNLIFVLLALLIDNLLGLNFKFDTNGVITTTRFGWSYSLYVFAIMMPSVAIMIRRLHDVGKTGWTALVSFIPFLGTFWLIILLCTKSNEYDNDWGANPYPIEEEMVEVEVVVADKNYFR